MIHAYAAVASRVEVTLFTASTVCAAAELLSTIMCWEHRLAWPWSAAKAPFSFAGMCTPQGICRLFGFHANTQCSQRVAEMKSLV